MTSFDLDKVFSSEGCFAEYFSGFTPRQEQLQMAEAVQAAIDTQYVTLIEAGTGVGKTFAYLVPALLSGKKVIVSTGTKALQEQLYEQDLATVCEVLRLSVKTALLKGRGNYLCPYRLQQNLASFSNAASKDYQQLQAISEWGETSITGDLSGTALLADNLSLWPKVTSSAENCLGQECPVWDQCFLVKARRKAQKADVVVVNHHLLFADFVLRDDGFGEVLPDADIFIVDEAHQLPDIGSQFLGNALGSRQLTDLSKDITKEMSELSNDMPDLLALTGRLLQVSSELEQASGGQIRTGPWVELERKDGFMTAMENLDNVLSDLNTHLLAVSERSKGLERCELRSADLRRRLHYFMPIPDDAHAQDRIVEAETTRADNFTVEGIDDVPPKPVSDNDVKWFERRTRALILRTTPLDIGESFNAFLDRSQASWIMTSATMTIANSFAYFSQRLGLEEATMQALGSPFDYEKQSILYLPQGLPDPRERNYTQKMMEKSLEVIELSEGRTFILFTSFRAMYEAETFLQNRVDYPLLVQGREGKMALLEKFRSLGNAVLLGTMSFWEGVDVKGSALSCVIIDKLPFTPPSDPVMSARIDAMKKRGRNPFMELQVPNAAILLQQGLGRLIRGANDHGVLMIADPRIRTKRYGKSFLNSLPKMTLTQNVDDISKFL